MQTRNDLLRTSTLMTAIVCHFCSSGCGTVTNLRDKGDHNSPYIFGEQNAHLFPGLDPNLRPPPPQAVFGGVRYDLFLHTVCSHGTDVIPLNGMAALCDVPMSLVADTAMLPVTVWKSSQSPSETE